MGHTACLWGAAAVLRQIRDTLRGTVKFIFQPAEETTGGADVLCAAGVLNGVQSIFALHGWPGLPVGQIGVRPGPLMASADVFHITVTGAGGHAAYPHLTIDPIVAGAQIVGALQTLASRETSPTEPVVVSVTQFHAGTATNVIPGEARLSRHRALFEPHRAGRDARRFGTHRRGRVRHLPCLVYVGLSARPARRGE